MCDKYVSFKSKQCKQRKSEQMYFISNYHIVNEFSMRKYLKIVPSKFLFSLDECNKKTAEAE